jgi:hypothetical protein
MLLPPSKGYVHASWLEFNELTTAVVSPCPSKNLHEDGMIFVISVILTTTSGQCRRYPQDAAAIG